MTDGNVCKPLTCGEVPQNMNAHCTKAGNAACGGQVVYGEPCDCHCYESTSVGGGSTTTFTLKCDSAGSMLPASPGCVPMTFRVQGYVMDATDPSYKLGDAVLEFRRIGDDGNVIAGTTVYTATSDRWGHYKIEEIPAGKYQIITVREGYTEDTSERTLTQNEDYMNIPLRKPVDEGEWSAVVSWGHYTKDVDSHTYFGTNFQKHVYWTSKNSDDTYGESGIKVSLDVDTTQGGVDSPETTTFENVGKCEVRGSCLIKFVLVNYNKEGTPSYKALGDSEITVKTFNSTSSTAMLWNVTTDTMETVSGDAKENCAGCNGPSWYTTIFTIDARKGVVGTRIFPGERHDPPYLDSESNQNWWHCSDNSAWCKVNHGELVSGFERSGSTGGLSNINRAKAIKVKNAAKIHCIEKQIDMSGSGKKWGECDPGTFMKGFIRQGTALATGSSGAHQIVGLLCCEPMSIKAGTEDSPEYVNALYPAGKPSSWDTGDCQEKFVLTDGWTTCNSGASTTLSAIVGIERGQCIGGATELTKVKCCAFPDPGLLEGPRPDPSNCIDETEDITQWAPPSGEVCR